MREPAPGDVTRLLLNWSGGDREALDELTPLVCEELRRQARRAMRRERPGHTLQTTALVNEVYIRLVDQAKVNWQNRAHFFAICAKLMRQILIDYARRRRSGGGERRAIMVSLDEASEVASERAAELIAVDEALESLAALDPRQSQIVELRFFGGLTIEETGHVMRISHATVEREWHTARAWLYREISRL
ncbi:MAG: sigma-70 family RNA polymerase sigma factor [Acidobacteria bacterium]|nr:sigma-70 family RNA polymerase sigma factor [Acidobacteriota bacterium]